MRRDWPIWVVLAAAAWFYLAYPTRTHEFDAIFFAAAAIKRASWIATDPGHLGFGPLVILAAGIGRSTEPPLNPIFILRFLSTAAALAGLFAFYRTLKDLGAGRGRAAMLVAILGTAYGYWHWALQAEPHILSTTFLLFFLWRFTRLVHSPSPRAAAWTGALLGLATLMHQKSILLVGPALIGLPFAIRKRGQLTATAGSFLAAYAVVAILPYLVVALGVLGLRRVSEVQRWVIGLGGYGTWGHWTLMTLPTAAVGMVRGLLGSDFLIALGPVKTVAAHLLPQYAMPDEKAVAASLPQAACWTLTLLEVAVLGFAIVALVRWSRSAAARFAGHAPLAAMLIAWLAIHTIFSAWWAPERAEFWIDFYPPLLALVALPRHGGAERQGRGLRAMGAFLLMLWTVNFFGSIRPQSLAATDPGTNFVVALDATVQPGAVVLSDTRAFGREVPDQRTFDLVDLLADFGGQAARGPEKSLGLVDSLWAAADSTGRSIYLVVTPLARTEAKRTAYRALVAALVARHDLAERVPIRADIEVRRFRVRGTDPHGEAPGPEGARGGRCGREPGG